MSSNGITDLARESSPPGYESELARRAARDRRQGKSSGWGRVRDWLGAPSARWWAIGLGLLLSATSLTSGLAADDYLHAIAIRNLPFPRPQSGPFDLFRFSSGDLANAQAMMNLGEFPWLSDPTCKFAFFRPLAAATHVLDYALWPSSPWLMHLQSMIWFGLGLAGVAAIYRRFLGATWIAGLATLLYAIDDTHGPTVTWIANRNALIAFALGLPVLLLHDRGKVGGSKIARWAAPLLFGTALLAGEATVAVAAYLAAYTLHIDRGAWRARLLGLVPYGAVLVVWRTIYVHLGYGVSGSGVYLDPARHPLAYLAGLPRRLPFLLLGEFALPRSDFGEIYAYVSPTATQWMIGFAIVVVGLFAAAMIPLWRRAPVARFFATGLLLASFPVCAAFPSDRLLLFVGVGAMGLVAQLIAAASAREEALPGRVAATFLAIVHLVIAPPLLAIKSHYNDFAGPNDLADNTLPATPDITSKTIVVVNPPNDLFYVYLQPSRIARGLPFPAHVRALAPVSTAVDVTRLDAQTLLVRAAGGYIEYEPERMLRTLENPLPVGSVVNVTGMSATIVATTADNRPAQVKFHFDVPLEDPSLVWFDWIRDGWIRDGYAPWKPPAIGETIHLPAHDLRRAALAIEESLTGTTWSR